MYIIYDDDLNIMGWATVFAPPVGEVEFNKYCEIPDDETPADFFSNPNDYELTKDFKLKKREE